MQQSCTNPSHRRELNDMMNRHYHRAIVRERATETKVQRATKLARLSMLIEGKGYSLSSFFTPPPTSSLQPTALLGLFPGFMSMSNIRPISTHVCGQLAPVVLLSFHKDTYKLWQNLETTLKCINFMFSFTGDSP